MKFRKIISGILAASITASSLWFGGLIASAAAPTTVTNPYLAAPFPTVPLRLTGDTSNFNFNSTVFPILGSTGVNDIYGIRFKVSSDNADWWSASIYIGGEYLGTDADDTAFSSRNSGNVIGGKSAGKPFTQNDDGYVTLSYEKRLFKGKDYGASFSVNRDYSTYIDLHSIELLNKDGDVISSFIRDADLEFSSYEMTVSKKGADMQFGGADWSPMLGTKDALLRIGYNYTTSDPYPGFGFVANAWSGDDRIEFQYSAATSNGYVYIPVDYLLSIGVTTVLQIQGWSGFEGQTATLLVPQYEYIADPVDMTLAPIESTEYYNHITGYVLTGDYSDLSDNTMLNISYSGAGYAGVGDFQFYVGSYNADTKQPNNDFYQCWIGSVASGATGVKTVKFGDIKEGDYDFDQKTDTLGIFIISTVQSWAHGNGMITGVEIVAAGDDYTPGDTYSYSTELKSNLSDVTVTDDDKYKYNIELNFDKDKICEYDSIVVEYAADDANAGNIALNDDENGKWLGQAAVVKSGVTKAVFRLATGQAKNPKLSLIADNDITITSVKVYSKNNDAWSYIPVYYDVTYYTGLAGTDATVVVEIEDGEPASATDPTLPTMTKTGYTFDKWYTDDKLTTAFDFTTPITADTEIYAKWNAKDVIVNFLDSSDKVIKAQVTTAKYDLTYGDIISTPANDEIPAGKFYGGWKLKGTDTKVTGTTKITSEGPIDLVVIWSDVETFKITFNANTGNASDNGEDVVDDGDAVDEPDEPTKTGYDFEGWYTDSACTIDYDFTTPVTADITLYAKWTISKFTVTFNTDGGSAVTIDPVTYLEKITEPTDPTKTGYDFVAWYKTSALTTAWDFATDTVTGNTTLYAKWTAKNYTVDFAVDGGSAVDPQTIAYDGKATKPANPTKTGYTFKGWFKDSAFATAFDFVADKITSDTTIYAKWEINEYTVEFKNTDIASKTVAYNELVDKPADPTKENYTFKGWFKDSGFKTAFDFTAEKITADTTIYALWELNAGVVLEPITLFTGENKREDKWSSAVLFNMTNFEPGRSGGEPEGVVQDSLYVKNEALNDTNAVILVTYVGDSKAQIVFQKEGGGYWCNFDPTSVVTANGKSVAIFKYSTYQAALVAKGGAADMSDVDTLRINSGNSSITIYEVKIVYSEDDIPTDGGSKPVDPDPVTPTTPTDTGSGTYTPTPTNNDTNKTDDTTKTDDTDTKTNPSTINKIAISKNTVKEALKEDEPVIKIEGKKTGVTVEVLEMIKDAEKPVTFELDGYSIIIDPETITDDAVALDLKMDFVAAQDMTDNNVTFPENGLVIVPSAHGDFGFTMTIVITEEMLEDLGIDVSKARLYYIDDDGNIEDLGEIELNADGTASISISHASEYLISDTAPTAASDNNNDDDDDDNGDIGGDAGTNSSTDGGSKTDTSKTDKNPNTGETAVSVSLLACTFISASLLVLTSKKKSK